MRGYFAVGAITGLAGLIACGGPQNAGDAGATCFRDDDCAYGLVCAIPNGSSARTCTADVSGLISKVDPGLLGAGGAMAGTAGVPAGGAPAAGAGGVGGGGKGGVGGNAGRAGAGGGGAGGTLSGGASSGGSTTKGGVGGAMAGGGSSP